MLVVSLDGERIRVESDERAVGNEVPTVLHLVEVAEDIEIGPLHLVPLRNCLVGRNEDSANATLIPDFVPVMEPNRHPVHLQIRVVPFGNDELHARLILEVTRKAIEHEVLERVPTLGGNLHLLGGAAVVPRVARNDNLIEIATLQEELDAGRDEIACVDGSIHRRKLIELHQLFMDVVGDEVTQQREHQGLDGRRLAHDLDQPEAILEKLVRPNLREIQIESVLHVDRRRLHALFDVPVASNHDRGCLTLTRRGLGRNLERITLRLKPEQRLVGGLRFVQKREGCVVLRAQSLDLTALLSELHLEPNFVDRLQASTLGLRIPLLLWRILLGRHSALLSSFLLTTFRHYTDREK